MLLRILSDKDPALRRKADSVRQGAPVWTIVADMHETMLAARGIGLAAPQVGEPYRIIVANTTGNPITLINPVIEKTSKHKTWGKEGCLSVPGKMVGVLRYVSLTVTGFNERWEPARIEARYLLARVIQHELDHLDGILMTDGELR
jgi:peptide deformylase